MTEWKVCRRYGGVQGHWYWRPERGVNVGSAFIERVYKASISIVEFEKSTILFRDCKAYGIGQFRGRGAGT